MQNKLEKYDKMITAGLVIIAFVFGIGWWFAEEKSEPVYLSKIDRLMFDKDNKAPRFVLTLPDEFMKKSSSETASIDLIATSKELEKESILQNEPFSLDKLLADVPSFFKLQAKQPSYELAQVDFNENLVERTPEGKTLPKVSVDGKRPWIEYGHLVNIQPNFKKISIVFSGLGLDATTVTQLSESFDSEVSFSFTPYMINSAPILTARQNGHETYVDLILASKDFLKEDTGPLSINPNLPLDANSERFTQTINKTAPISGLIVRDGASLLSNTLVMDHLLSEIKNRGLLVVDATSDTTFLKSKAEGLPRRKADIVINKDMTETDIKNALHSAENLAFDKGQVLIVSDPKPLAVMMLYDWVHTFSPQVSYEEAKTVDISKPFALVPLSNLVVE